MSEKLSERAKTIVELCEGLEVWKKVFEKGAKGSHVDYNFARDTRHLYEEVKWIPLYLVEELEFENQKLKEEIKGQRRNYMNEFENAQINSDLLQNEFELTIKDLESKLAEAEKRIEVTKKQLDSFGFNRRVDNNWIVPEKGNTYDSSPSGHYSSVLVPTFHLGKILFIIDDETYHKIIDNLRIGDKT